MKPRKPNESDDQYIKRLESANASLKKHNDVMTKWGSALNEAVTTLSCDASVAFQAMAEKAGVRSHPSVTAVVELFDTISHPQWRGDKVIPKVEFPRFWDLDSQSAWSGDADMTLNSPIAQTIEFLEHLKFSKGAHWQTIQDLMDGLHKVAHSGIDGIKTARGFEPKHFSPATGHIMNMDAEQLRDLLSSIGWLALDLAQDMAFANESLRRDLRAATYRRVCADLYRLTQLSAEVPDDTGFGVKVLGAEADRF